ncbi:MAG: hypothetical protein ABSB54_06070 [Acidimicrobiales bacterium]
MSSSRPASELLCLELEPFGGCRHVGEGSAQRLKPLGVHAEECIEGIAHRRGTQAQEDEPRARGNLEPAGVGEVGVGGHEHTVVEACASEDLVDGRRTRSEERAHDVDVVPRLTQCLHDLAYGFALRAVWLTVERAGSRVNSQATGHVPPRTMPCPPRSRPAQMWPATG